MTSKFVAHTPQKGSDQWHGLKEHLTKVADLTETSANKLYAGKLGYYAGLWHDLGNLQMIAHLLVKIIRRWCHK